MRNKLRVLVMLMAMIFLLGGCAALVTPKTVNQTDIAAMTTDARLVYNADGELMSEMACLMSAHDPDECTSTPWLAYPAAFVAAPLVLPVYGAMHAWCRGVHGFDSKRCEYKR